MAENGFVFGFGCRERKKERKAAGLTETPDRIFCLSCVFNLMPGIGLASSFLREGIAPLLASPVNGIEKWLRSRFGCWLAPGWWRLGVLRLRQGWTSSASRVADGVGHIRL